MIRAGGCEQRELGTFGSYVRAAYGYRNGANKVLGSLARLSILGSGISLELHWLKSQTTPSGLNPFI